jgi:tight adherence protein B
VETIVDFDVIAISVLSALTVGGIFYALVYPYLSGEVKADKRMSSMSVNPKLKAAESRMADISTARKKSVTESLKELESQQSEKRKVSLKDRIDQAGYSFTPKAFYYASAGTAVLFAVIALVLSGNPMIAMSVACIGGLGLPNWFLANRKQSRIKAFIKDFPNGIDIIVRGIKSGLPLGDCLRIIASEAQEPVKTEFRAIVEAQTMGLSIADACGRLTKRMPIQEANFFAIVIQIQQTAGGNLAEALSNLSKVLRDRKRMRDKISAMSMEAKASGVIIAALPFIVGVMVQLSSPGFIAPLFATNAGNIALLGSAFWMLCGIIVMKSMINFDI